MPCVIQQIPPTTPGDPWVTVVTDRVPGHKVSHLVIGPTTAVAREVARIIRQFSGAHVVSHNGQGDDHYEVVVHRPAPIVR